MSSGSPCQGCARDTGIRPGALRPQQLLEVHSRVSPRKTLRPSHDRVTLLLIERGRLEGVAREHDAIAPSRQHLALGGSEERPPEPAAALRLSHPEVTHLAVAAPGVAGQARADRTRRVA